MILTPDEEQWRIFVQWERSSTDIVEKERRLVALLQAGNMRAIHAMQEGAKLAREPHSPSPPTSWTHVGGAPLLTGITNKAEYFGLWRGK